MKRMMSVAVWAVALISLLAVAFWKETGAGHDLMVVDPTITQGETVQRGSAVAGSAAILQETLRRVPIMDEETTAEPRVSFWTHSELTPDNPIALLDSKRNYHVSHYIGRRDNADYRVYLWVLVDPGLSGPGLLVARDQHHREIELNDAAARTLNDGRRLMMLDLGEMPKTVGDFITFEYDVRAAFGRNELCAWVSTERAETLNPESYTSDSISVTGAAALDASDCYTVSSLNNSSQELAIILFLTMLLLVYAAAWLKTPSGMIPGRRG